MPPRALSSSRNSHLVSVDDFSLQDRQCYPDVALVACRLDVANRRKRKTAVRTVS